MTDLPAVNCVGHPAFRCNDLQAMNVTTVGVWLIGLGSLVIFAGLVLSSERPYTGRSYRGPFNTRRDRLRFAVEGAGAGLVAVGSVLLAIEHLPSPWLFSAVPGTCLMVYGLTAWKLRQYWQYRLAADPSTQPGGTPSSQLAMATFGTWRWCLTHPFNDESWPRDSD